MDTPSSTSNRSALWWGGGLVVLGLVFLLNNFNLLPANVFGLWPVLIIGAGLWLVVQAVTRRSGGSLMPGIVLLALGGFWLLENFDRADGRLFLPVLLIAIGVGQLARYFFREA